MLVSQSMEPRLWALKLGSLQLGVRSPGFRVATFWLGPRGRRVHRLTQAQAILLSSCCPIIVKLGSSFSCSVVSMFLFKELDWGFPSPKREPRKIES